MTTRKAIQSPIYPRRAVMLGLKTILAAIFAVMVMGCVNVETPTVSELGKAQFWSYVETHFFNTSDARKGSTFQIVEKDEMHLSAIPKNVVIAADASYLEADIRKAVATWNSTLGEEVFVFGNPSLTYVEINRRNPAAEESHYAAFWRQRARGNAEIVLVHTTSYSSILHELGHALDFNHSRKPFATACIMQYGNAYAPCQYEVSLHNFLQYMRKKENITEKKEWWYIKRDNARRYFDEWWDNAHSKQKEDKQ